MEESLEGQCVDLRGGPCVDFRWGQCKDLQGTVKGFRGQSVDLGGGAMCGFPIYMRQCVDLRGPVCGFMRGKCVDL
jgi:hypothetical protein